MSKDSPKKADKIPKKNGESESFKDYEARLLKNAIPQPKKRDFDIKRQRIEREEKNLRRQANQMEKQILEKQKEHTVMKEKAAGFKDHEIFVRFNAQRQLLRESTKLLTGHNDAINALRRKKGDFQKTLMGYRTTKELEDAILREQKKIERGDFQNISEEKRLIKQIEKLRKLRPVVKEYEAQDKLIADKREDKTFKDNENVKKQHHQELKNLETEKKEIEAKRNIARTNMNNAWDQLQELYKKKKALLKKAEEKQKEARKVNTEYLDAEKIFLKYQSALENAQQKAKAEARKTRRKSESEAQKKAEEEAIRGAGPSRAVRQQESEEELRKKKEEQEKRLEAQRAKVSKNAEAQRARAKEKRKEKAEKKKAKGEGPDGGVEIQITETVVPFYEELERLRAIKGYLSGLIPKPRDQQQPDPNAPPRRKKRKPRKPKGPCRHNLHWVNAFAEAGCSKHLPHRREKVQACIEEITKMLEELEKKSEEKKERLKNGIPEPEAPPTNGHDTAKESEPAGGDVEKTEDAAEKDAAAEEEPDKDAAADKEAEPKQEAAPDDAAKTAAAEAPEEVAAT